MEKKIFDGAFTGLTLWIDNTTKILKEIVNRIEKLENKVKKLESNRKMLKILNKLMNKRGQGWEVLVATIMIGITLFGVYNTISEGGKIYVGDKNTNVYYEYSKCENEVKNISEKDIVVFNSQVEAEKLGYKFKNCD